jgi:CheY-like chemotaxis protein
MFTHGQIWHAIDALAHHRGWSTSRLAVRAGLDATALNPSKRTGRDGKPRWPSTETIAKLLSVTGTSPTRFWRCVEDSDAALFAQRKILFVDDDLNFRDCSASTLSKAGYEVHVASNHRDALDLLDSGQRIDVLCTDIVMPEGLGGIALARQARKRRPHLKVVYITGYDIPGLKSGADESVLLKPLGAVALLAEVGRLLEIAPGAG